MLHAVVNDVRLCGFAYKHNALIPSSSELPYGWEEIDDPQYGTYYVE